MKSKILVTLQFFIIFLMFLEYSTQTQYLYVGLAITFLGITIGILAFQEHESNNFNIRPDIKENCKLVTTGIYTYIRHPMYLAVLLSMLGVVVIYFTYYELILFICLLSTLLVKLFYEESLWKCHSSAYNEYLRNTKRLIPYIF